MAAANWSSCADVCGTVAKALTKVDVCCVYECKLLPYAAHNHHCFPTRRPAPRRTGGLVVAVGLRRGRVPRGPAGGPAGGVGGHPAGTALYQAL